MPLGGVEDPNRRSCTWKCVRRFPGGGSRAQKPPILPSAALRRTPLPGSYSSDYREPVTARNRTAAGSDLSSDDPPIGFLRPFGVERKGRP
jgi:hypothetical protein